MKGETWRNEWPEAWDVGVNELGLDRPFIGRLVHRHPVVKVAEAFRAARGKKEPKAYVIGVLKGNLDD